MTALLDIGPTFLATTKVHITQSTQTKTWYIHTSTRGTTILQSDKKSVLTIPTIRQFQVGKILRTRSKVATNQHFIMAILGVYTRLDTMVAGITQTSHEALRFHWPIRHQEL